MFLTLRRGRKILPFRELISRRNQRLGLSATTFAHRNAERSTIRRDSMAESLASRRAISDRGSPGLWCSALRPLHSSRSSGSGRHRWQRMAERPMPAGRGRGTATAEALPIASRQRRGSSGERLGNTRFVGAGRAPVQCRERASMRNPGCEAGRGCVFEGGICWCPCAVRRTVQ